MVKMVGNSTVFASNKAIRSMIIVKSLFAILTVVGISILWVGIRVTIEIWG